MSVSKSIADLTKEELDREATKIAEPDEGEFVFDSDTAAAGLAATSSLAVQAGKRNYISGFTISTGQSITASVSGTVTVTGLGTTLNYQLAESITQGGLLDIKFTTSLPASAVAQAITVNVPIIASGGPVAVSVYGYAKAE